MNRLDLFRQNRRRSHALSAIMLAVLCSVLGCGQSSSDPRDPIIEQQARQIEQLNQQILDLQEKLREAHDQTATTREQVDEAHKTNHWTKNMIIVVALFGIVGFFVGISLGTMTKKDATVSSKNQEAEKQETNRGGRKVWTENVVEQAITQPFSIVD